MNSRDCVKRSVSLSATVDTHIAVDSFFPYQLKVSPVAERKFATTIRGNGFACEDAMLYMHISRLRRKLGAASDLIVNKHGVGYCLAR